MREIITVIITTANAYCSSLYTRSSFKYFTFIRSFTPHSNFMMKASPPFYRLRNGGSKNKSFPKVTQLVSCRTQAGCTFNHSAMLPKSRRARGEVYYLLQKLTYVYTVSSLHSCWEKWVEATLTRAVALLRNVTMGHYVVQADNKSIMVTDERNLALLDSRFQLYYLSIKEILWRSSRTIDRLAWKVKF